MKRIHIKKVSGDNSLITVVSKFESAVTAIVDGKEYNAKSIMSSVAINDADNLELVISGPDEKQAAETINNLFCS
ncbi:MAG: HPr family phosphocarrier protein [Lachnospiraceae bacterium]|nr:HPr family phosphocarrier protein [Lachnospiraceae bacterium]